jgi:Transposase IS66 family
MGKAIHYALDQWESPEVYLQDPLIEIDNNLVENAIRPTALGKNYEQSRIRQSLEENNSHLYCAAVG